MREPSREQREQEGAREIKTDQRQPKDQRETDQKNQLDMTRPTCLETVKEMETTRQDWAREKGRCGGDGDE